MIDDIRDFYRDEMFGLIRHWATLLELSDKIVHKVYWMDMFKMEAARTVPSLYLLLISEQMINIETRFHHFIRCF